MSQLTQAIKEVNATLPSNVLLLAVSKTHPVEMLQEAYAIGQRDFGENKVQEMTEKASVLPTDIRWHMIGHLQTNKVKYIAPFVSLIHSVDSPKLLSVIDKEAKKVGRVIDCLLQVHVAEELSKFGFAPDDLKMFLSSGQLAQFPNVRIRGVMAMATNTDDVEQLKSEFELTRTLFENIKNEFFKQDDSFSLLSMGMSNDYKIAVEYGANIVRIGSLIFGQRDYSVKN
ncbi:MAG: YggS family pyridoxal phosphate-dependent enzyme [Bacteroidales bacterium]|nr:YggS family pyridoxal phosphate-dependent enzyme [Bacteroidales bacterium]